MQLRQIGSLDLEINYCIEDKLRQVFVDIEMHELLFSLFLIIIIR